MDLSSATSPRVRFWFSMSYYWSISPENNYDFKVNVKDNTTTTVTEIWTEATQGVFDNFTWYEVTLDLTAYVGKNDIQIEFNYSGTDGAALYFDDITIEEAPTCEVPTVLTVANIGTTSVNIGWTASTTGETAWEYVVQVAGGNAPSGAGTGTSTNPTNITGLTANTAYEFYVRADCTGGDYSSWVGPMAFTTACDTFTAPYSEDFENTGTIPDCWTMSGGEDWLFANTGTGNHIGNNGTIDGATTSGGYFAWVDSSGAEPDAILESPFVDVSGLTTPALSFYELSNSEDSANSQLVVEIWDGAAWNTVGTYNTNTNGWEEKMIDLSGLTFTGAAKVRFTFTEPTSGDFDDDIAIDDVKFYELPSCLPPTNITATSTSTTNVDITWTVGGSETNWSYEYGTTGFTQGTGTTGTTTSASLSLTTLTQGEAYDIYIQANCGGGDDSTFATATWTQPLPPPANDDCENTISLTVNTNLSCSIVTAGTTVGATASSQTDDVTGTPNTDVWFSFTATDTAHTVSLLNIVNQGGTSTSTDMGMGIYDGTGGCAGLVLFDDSDPELLSLTGLTIATTYYVRVYGWYSSIQYNNFDICVGTPPPPPANDDCTNATNVGSLPFNETMDATAATNNSGFISECGGMNDGVWYTFTTVDAGTIDIAITGVTGWDPKLALYSGSCGTFTCVNSADAGNSGGDETLSGVAVDANTQYWINIGHYSSITNSSEGPFTINISTSDTTVLKVESNSIENFTLFPTLVKDNLSFTSQEKVDVLTIYNIMGQEVLSRKPALTNGNINVSSLSNGMYIVKVKAGNSLGSYKIIKK